MDLAQIRLFCPRNHWIRTKSQWICARSTDFCARSTVLRQIHWVLLLERVVLAWKRRIAGQERAGRQRKGWIVNQDLRLYRSLVQSVKGEEATSPHRPSDPRPNGPGERSPGPQADALGKNDDKAARPERPRDLCLRGVPSTLAAFQAASLCGCVSQGIGLRPQKPWARLCRPVGPGSCGASLFTRGWRLPPYRPH